MAYFDIKLSTDKGPIILAWSNSQHLKYFAMKQNPVKFKISKDDDKLFQEKLQWWSAEWNTFSKIGYFDLPNNARIIDVGSGIGILSLLIHRYLKLQDKNSICYLLDNQQNDTITQDFTDGCSYGFFNHWEPLHNAISTTNLNKDCFKLLNLFDQFPDQTDLIISRRSWCYHYPYQFYRDRMLNSLKIGGKLCLDVYDVHNQIKEISNDMNSEPVYKINWKSISSVTSQSRNISTCMWVRK